MYNYDNSVKIMKQEIWISPIPRYGICLFIWPVGLIPKQCFYCGLIIGKFKTVFL